MTDSKHTLTLKLFDDSLPVPQYQTDGSVGLDLYARTDVIIAPHTVERVPLNVALQLPDSHWALLAARSSLHKKGLMLANGIGVGDQDFCGDNDEYQAALLNFTDQPVKVEKGERLVQLLVLPYTRVDLQVVSKLENQDRGGFGSTG